MWERFAKQQQKLYLINAIKEKRLVRQGVSTSTSP
jgi:hypothetical protein